MVNQNQYREMLKKIDMPFSGLVRYEEPMAEHSTFKVGGPADLWIQPDAACFESYVPALLLACAKEGLVVFVLGGGANLVFSDKGIRAVVLDTGGWTDAGCQTSDIQSVPGFSFRAGTPVDKLAVMTAERGFAGLQAFAGMPGSLGGALWMNARCYGAEMADLKPRVKLLHKDGTLETLAFDAAQWAYKKSPFQAMAGSLILEAELDLKPGERAELIEEAESHRADREKKGHYRLPSGGSAFKNNRSFGEPTGKIIDESGLRGLQVGGAQVAPWHGNIIVNTGKASAQDVRDLVMLVQDKVYKARGFLLEPELLFAGDW